MLTHEHLLRRVWGLDADADIGPMQTTISSIRRKLGDDAEDPKYILTQLRVGYRMAKGETQQDDCKVFPDPIMVSLSNHRRLGRASFDKLRTSGHRHLELLCNRPRRRRGRRRRNRGDVIHYIMASSLAGSSHEHAR